MHFQCDKGLLKISKAFSLHLSSSSRVQGVCGILSTKSGVSHCNYHRNSVILIKTYFSQGKQVLHGMTYGSRVRYMLLTSHTKIKMYVVMLISLQFTFVYIIIFFVSGLPLLLILFSFCQMTNSKQQCNFVLFDVSLGLGSKIK